MDNNTFPQTPASAPTPTPTPIPEPTPAPAQEPIVTPGPTQMATATPITTPEPISEPVTTPAPATTPMPEPIPAATISSTPAPTTPEIGATIGSNIAAPTDIKKKNKINFKSPLFIGIICGGVALIAAAIILVIVLTSQNPLAGTWKLSKYERDGQTQDVSSMGIEISTTSDREGKYKSTYGSSSTEYKFLYNNNYIVAWDENSSYGSASAFKYEIKDGKLILTPSSGTGSDKVYLEKK